MGMFVGMTLSFVILYMPTSYHDEGFGNALRVSCRSEEVHVNATNRHDVTEVS